jgi:hypothetical protein
VNLPEGTRGLAPEHDAGEAPALRRFAGGQQVRLVQSGDLALLNYEKDIRNEDWNDFNRQCRGVVLDLFGEEPRDNRSEILNRWPSGG